MKLLFLLPALLLIASSASAQWEPEVRLTNQPLQSFTSPGRGLVAGGDTLHLVFYDFRGNVWEIYYKRSTDKGATWGEDVRLTNDALDSFNPTIGVSGSDVHVTWGDLHGGVSQVYTIRSTDGGETWQDAVRVTTTTVYAGLSSIVADGPTVHLAWVDSRDGGRRIAYARSTDRGATWEPYRQMNLPTAVDTALSPRLAVDDGVAHLSWTEWGDTIRYLYGRSTDGGSTWSEPVVIAEDPVRGGYTVLQFQTISMSVSGSDVHFTWQGTPETLRLETYYIRSTDGGLTWEERVQLTSYDGSVNWNAANPSVAADGDDVIIAWDDQRFAAENIEIFYARSTDGGSSWTGNLRLTDAPSNSRRPMTALIDGSMHTVWFDLRDLQYELYYRRNLTGILTGVSIETDGTGVAATTTPNPFDRETVIGFTLTETVRTSVRIYDLGGNLVATLVDATLAEGPQTVVWDARRDDGTPAVSGRYHYSIEAGRDRASGSLMVTR